MNTYLKKLQEKPFYILIAIFIIALIFRMYQLGTVPHELHNDEVANAYAARYIIENGHDIYGNTWPLLYFDKFNDYPPVVPMYFSGFGTYIFGNNDFGARSLLAIVGAMVVFPAYYMALYLFKREKIALITAALFALGPWHIVLSRLSAEGILALTVYLAGLAVLFKAIQKERMSWLIAAGILLLSTYLMYPSFRIIVPLTLFPSIIVAYFHQIRNKKFLAVCALFTIVAFALTISISSTVWGKGRFEQTSLVSPVSGVELKIQQLIFNEDNIWTARVYNNKLIGFGREFLFQYSRYFSFNYLFGEDGIPHIYSVPYMGLLHLSIIPFILLAAFGFIQKRNKKTDHILFLYVIYILLISPIPAALTVLDVPSIHRALLTPALVIFIAAYGINGIIDLKWKKIPIIMPFVLIFFGETVFFSHQYFQNFSYYNTIYRTNGNTEAVKYAFDHKNEYEQIYITNQEGWLPIFYLFYANDYNSEYTGKFKYNLRLANSENVNFPEEECPSVNIMNNSLKAGKLTVPQKTLIIEPISCKSVSTPIGSEMFSHIKTIKRLDETEVFDIIEVNPRFDEQLLKETTLAN
ncbi:glycosyltransferase family 39 protein [Candidatus Roizmanbacteria bacterium]|nr:MAG: glycosyltransferase family 39 protein [Candidatus Roizmanbacteria bacterium]